MLVALETKNKELFITKGFLCLSSSNPLHNPWRCCNRMVISWLTRSMTPTIKHSIMWMETVAEIWTDLKERFSHANTF